MMIRENGLIQIQSQSMNEVGFLWDVKWTEKLKTGKMRKTFVSEYSIGTERNDERTL